MKYKKEKTVPHDISTDSDKESITEKKVARPLLKRWRFWLFTVTAVFLLLLTFALPFGVKQYAIDWLKKNGIEQAVIERLGWNPFTGRLWLDGVNLAHNGQTVMEHGALDVNIDYASLFSKNIALSSAHYSGLVLEVEQKKDGSWQIATITIPPFETEDTANLEEVVVQGAGEDTGKEARQQISKAWAFLADDVSIRDCRIHYKAPNLDLTLHIDSAELKRFSTRAASPAGSLFLQGSVNGKAVRLNLHNVVLTPALQLAGRVEIDQFDLNSLDDLLHDYLPFWSGIAALAGDAEFTLDDSGMAVHYDGNISVTGADVGAASYRNRAERLSWHGKVRYTMPAKGAMEVATDGILQGDGYSLQLPGQELATSEKLVKLSGSTMVRIGDAIEVDHKGNLRIDAIAFSMSEVEAEEASLLWRGAVSFVQKDAGGSNLSLDGTLTGEKSGVRLPEEELSLQNVKLLAKSGLHFTEEFTLTGHSSLLAENFALYSHQQKSPMATLGSLAINSVAGKGEKEIEVARVVGENFSLKTSGELPLSIAVPVISAEQLLVSKLKSLTLNSFMLKKPAITSQKNGKNLLTGNSLTLAGIEAKKDAADAGVVRVERLALDRLHFLDKKEGVSLRWAKMKSVSVSEKDGFSAEKLALDGLSTTIIRQKSSEINLARQFAAMSNTGQGVGADSISARAGKGNTGQEVEADSISAPPSFPVKLAKIQLAGESRIAFQDHTLEVPYKTTIKIDQLELGSLDTSQPDVKTPVKLFATVDDRAPLAIDGTLAALQKDIGLDLSLSLKNYPLDNLSPYTIESIGMGLGEGELQVKSSVLLENEVLKNSNQLLLQGLVTERISENLAKNLDHRLPVPFDMALFLLRDSDGNIKLSVPLKGRLDDLHVGIDDIIVTALEKAVVSAMAGYAIYSLGPYGALAYAGMKLGEDLLKEDDLPLIFMVKETALVAQQKKALEPLGKELQEEKGDIQIRPVVASWELMGKEEIDAVSGECVPVALLPPEIRQQLDELGQSRAKNIQHYLIEEYGIRKGRILLGSTVIKEEKKMLPLVVLHKKE